jgi:hypothetical protein
VRPEPFIEFNWSLHCAGSVFVLAMFVWQIGSAWLRDSSFDNDIAPWGLSRRIRIAFLVRVWTCILGLVWALGWRIDLHRYSVR